MTLYSEYKQYDDPIWVAARQALALSNTRIAHIDTGLFAHPSLGFVNGQPPANVALAEGRNFYDPHVTATPMTDLAQSTDPLGKLIEFPAHGVQTLGVILSDSPLFRGAAPGAKVIPCRVGNGPVFRNTQSELAAQANATARIGRAIDHALSLPNPPRVISISMGNPGFIPWELFRLLIGGSIGLAKSATTAIERAWSAGVPVVCAAGQLEHSIIYPALLKQCIAVSGYAISLAGALSHYPAGVYNNQSRIDSWALAVGLNRPGGDRINGVIVPNHASTDMSPTKPTGTSYAAPFVAAGYALCFEKFRPILTSAEFSGPNAWRRIETFRRILRQSMPVLVANSGTSNQSDLAIRPLDIVRLLTVPPEIAGPV